MRRSLLGIGLILLSTVVAGAEPPQAPPPRRIPIEEWIAQLGSAKRTERDEATKNLYKLVLDPPPELLAATQSEDVDVRDRATRAVEAMRLNVRDARVPGHGLAKQGRVDLFVAASATWGLKADDSRMWESAFELGQRLIEKAKMNGNRKPHNCPSSFRDFATYQRLRIPRFTRVDELHKRDGDRRNESIQAPGIIDSSSLMSGLIVSRGNVDTMHVNEVVILANGNVTVGAISTESVIICDGDVTIAKGYISRCLIVARGDIFAKGGANTSVLMAGGKVKLEGKRLTTGDKFNAISENAVEPLGITFIELSTVGVEVKAAKDVVQVSAVAKGKAFEKAGVQIGDTILTVEGKKPDSAESLRQLLRDALAIGDATVTLRRGEKTETVKVVLPE